MKKTDYAPRAADFDTYLKGSNLVGIEIGVDVGAHAEAMLTYCNIEMLYLVDPWEREFYRGYCEGRLNAKGFMHKIHLMQLKSLQAVKYFDAKQNEIEEKGFPPELVTPIFDFIYIDQLHDHTSVKNDLEAWWTHLKKGGVFGYRNYAESNVGLKMAVDEFITDRGITNTIERGEIILHKGK